MGRKSNSYKNVVENIRKLSKNIENISKDASVYLCDYIEYDLKKIVERRIKDYYWDYSPMYYRRSYSLYDVCTIENNGKTFSYTFNSDNMPDTHRVSNEYIFKWMFEEGYHGGARKRRFTKELGETYMSYRTPSPISMINSENKRIPWSRWSKYPVYKSSSPAIAINNDIEKYKKEELKRRTIQAINSAFFKYDISF